jgi:two-component system response regulator HydG
MVGARKTQKVDVRIVASSNKDLQSLVHKELFREDLFFRLNVVSITVPPLRNRQEDIPLLVSHFGAKFARELGKPEPVFPAETMEIFMNYAWPGNVRELENLVQRMVIMAEGETVTIPDLPSVMRFSALSGPVPFRSLAEEEAGYIRMVLASVGGNKSRAAEILGIDRKTLREKIKQAPLPGDKPSGK